MQPSHPTYTYVLAGSISSYTTQTHNGTGKLPKVAKGPPYIFTNHSNGHDRQLLLLQYVTVNTIVAKVVTANSSTVTAINIIAITIDKSATAVATITATLANVLHFLNLVQHNLLNILLNTQDRNNLLLSDPNLLHTNTPHAIQSTSLTIVNNIKRHFIQHVNRYLLRMFNRRVRKMITTTNPTTRYKGLLQITIIIQVPRHREDRRKQHMTSRTHYIKVIYNT